MKLSISTTRRETLLGWSYLLISLFVLPFLLELSNLLLAKPVSATVLNLVYFSVNFISVAVIFRRFLTASAKAALAAPWRCLRFAALGLFAYLVTMNLISHGIELIDPNFSNVNDNMVNHLSQEHRILMGIATMFLAPISEETLHRGLVFQCLQRKNRFLAYSLSMLIFGAIHIMNYIGFSHWLTLLLCFVQYLPAGLVLAWAYEKTDTVITPIIIHITINQIGFAAMR